MKFLKQTVLFLTLSTVFFSCSDDDADVVDVESILTDSQVEYAAAADGDWIEITEAEFNNLASELDDVSKVGSADASYNLTPTTFTGDFTVTNVGEPEIPANSYVFAVKYKLFGDDDSDIRIKQSFNTNSEGYSNLGGILGGNSAGEHFMVLKGSNVTNSNQGYLAIYGKQVGYISDNLGGLAYDNGDVNTFTRTQDDSFIFFQGLSTTKKQW